MPGQHAEYFAPSERLVHQTHPVQFEIHGRSFEVKVQVAHFVAEQLIECPVVVPDHHRPAVGLPIRSAQFILGCEEGRCKDILT